MNKKQNSLMRFSRTERLAQLSEQEIVIERKKREIQAKLEAQKKKQSEEAFRKLEPSKEIKTNIPGLSKKSSSSGVEHQKDKIKKKADEPAKESLTNAFSNDGSFLDQFKKLSQSGLSRSNVDMTPANPREEDIKSTNDTLQENLTQETSRTENVSSRDQNQRRNNSQATSIGKPLESKVQFQIPPPGVVQLLPQLNNNNQLTSGVDSSSSMISILPQFQGCMQQSVSAFSTKNVQMNSSPFSNDSMPSELAHSPSTSLTSIQPLLPNTSSTIQNQNSHHKNELPKLRSESISLTLKTNTIKKLESIPNPLETDQESSPPSPKKNQCYSKGVKETFFNATSMIENVTSQNRESTRISSAFNDNFEEDEEGDVPMDEKYHHWAELVARCGDGFEDSLRNRNQNDPNIRFLLNKNSKEYFSFRKLVSSYRKRLCSSDEEPLEKTLKLNSPQSYNEKEVISSNKEAKYYSKSSDEDNVDGAESKTHSKFSDNREESHLQELKPTSKDDYPLYKESPDENSKEENSKEISEQFKSDERRKRKRKSRWGDAVPTSSTPGVSSNLSLQSGNIPAPKSTLLSQLTRSDPGLIQYARQTFGSTNLSEEDWKKAEDHYKINLLYQDMVKKRAELEKLERQGKFKYEYDSDEDTEGGTWEHKLRQQEMQATQLWAEELTRQAAGKHHIGDFLPPEELERFLEKYNAVKEGREPDLSDYKEYKLKEDNVGYRLLQKMGWNEGQGLGQDGSGITNPVNKATTRHENQGLGIERPDGLEAGDDEYDAYRKRMMLAYRFRPNPLNNPRRPYY